MFLQEVFNVGSFPVRLLDVEDDGDQHVHWFAVLPHPTHTSVAEDDEHPHVRLVTERGLTDDEILERLDAAVHQLAFSVMVMAAADAEDPNSAVLRLHIDGEASD